MAPALSRTLGASSVAALRPSPSRGLPRGALAPQGKRCARGVRWDAGRARCVSAVAEKAASEEEEAAGEKFEYQAEVGGGVAFRLPSDGRISGSGCIWGATLTGFCCD
jgi:heat shock protein beta